MDNTFFKQLIYRVDKQEFKNLAKEIERIFPTESEATYYTSFKIENGIRFGESGKLYNHFEYVKLKMREEGILQPKKNCSERNQLSQRQSLPSYT